MNISVEEAPVRTFVAILVFYANAVAPWLCCCTAANVADTVPGLRSEIPQAPKCRHCCEPHEPQPISVSDRNPKPLPHECPCPVQAKAFAERPDVTVERISTDFQILLVEFGNWDFFEILTDRLPFLQPAVGSLPTLLMSELRLRFHHCFLC